MKCLIIGKRHASNITCYYLILYWSLFPSTTFPPTENTNDDITETEADENLKMEEQLEGIGNSTIEVSNDLMNLSKQLDNIRDQHQQGLFHYRQNICIGRFHKLISCTLICCLLTVITPIFHVFHPSYCILKFNKVNVNDTIYTDLIYQQILRVM